VLGDVDGVARELEGRGVERLRDERALPDVEQVAGRRVDDARDGGEKYAALLGVERAEADVVILRARGVAEEEEVSAVREEVGPAVRLLLLAHARRQDGRAAAGGDAVQPVDAGEEDHAAAAPRAAPVLRRVAQRLRAAARGVDLV
jgi:hypothetical protein